MKFIKRAVPEDPKSGFREIVKNAIEGDGATPKEASIVELFPIIIAGQGDEPVLPLTDEQVTKLVNQLRAGISSVAPDGVHFSVKLCGNLAEVTVNQKPTKRAPNGSKTPKTTKKAAGEKPPAVK